MHPYKDHEVSGNVSCSSLGEHVKKNKAPIIRELRETMYKVGKSVVLFVPWWVRNAYGRRGKNARDGVD